NTVAPPSAAAVPEPDKGSDILFSPVNKKGHRRPVKNTPSKAPADAFCVVLSDVICAGGSAKKMK
nr:hypothetical protein [Escherichia coli]